MVSQNKWKKEVALLFILSILFTHRILVLDDNILPAAAESVEFLMSQVYYRDAVLVHKQFPLWNSYISPGVPFITYNTFHNFLSTPIVLVFGEVLGVKLVLFLCVFFSGAGMWLFTKRILGVGAFSRVFSASAYMLAGYFIVNAFHVGKIHRALGATIIPYAFLLLMLGLKEKKSVYYVLTAVFMSLFIFSGSNYFFQYFFFSFVLYAVFSCVNFDGKTRRLKVEAANLKPFFVVGFLFLMFSAVRLLPIMELQGNTYRIYDGFEDYTDPFLGSQLLHEYVGRLYSAKLGWAFWDHYAFVGWFIPVFAALSVFHKNRDKRYLYILLVFFVLYGMGRYGPFRFITPYVPLMKNLRWPGRSIQFVVFTVCALAGLGFEWFLKKLSGKGRLPQAVYGLAVFYIIASVSAAHSALLMREYGYIIASSLFPTRYIIPALLAGVVVAAWAFRESPKLALSKKLLVSGILSMNILTLFLVNGWFVNPALSPMTSETVQVFEWLRDYDPSTYSIRMDFYGNDWGTYLYPAYKLGFVFDSYGYGPIWLTYAKGRNLTLNKYLVTDTQIYNDSLELVKSFEGVDHRIYDHVRDDGYTKILENRTDFHIYRVVDAVPHAFTTGSGTYKKVADITELTPNRITINASKEDGFDKVVVVSNYYPGWKFSINGGKSSDAKNFKGFISAPLKQGDSTYTFTFSPAPVKIGALLTLTSLFIFAYLVLRGRQGGRHV